MSGMTDYTEVAVLNAALNGVAFQVSNQYVQLHVGDPGESGASNVLSDSGASRKAGSFGSPTSGAGTCANDAEIVFNTIVDTGPFVVSHFSIWDALTSGNCILKGALAISKSFSQDDVPRFPVGSLIVTAA